MSGSSAHGSWPHPVQKQSWKSSAWFMERTVRWSMCVMEKTVRWCVWWKGQWNDLWWKGQWDDVWWKGQWDDMRDRKDSEMKCDAFFTQRKMLCWLEWSVFTRVLRCANVVVVGVVFAGPWRKKIPWRMHTHTSALFCFSFTHFSSDTPKGIMPWPWHGPLWCHRGQWFNSLVTKHFYRYGFQMSKCGCHFFFFCLHCGSNTLLKWYYYWPVNIQLELVVLLIKTFLWCCFFLWRETEMGYLAFMDISN